LARALLYKALAAGLIVQGHAMEFERNYLNAIGRLAQVVLAVGAAAVALAIGVIGTVAYIQFLSS
jgi:hypothetical protein